MIGAVLVLLVALAPTMLFGDLSAFGLIQTAAGVLGVGLLVRWGGGAGGRALGTILVAIGTVILALVLGLMALFLLGGSPYY